MKYAIAVNDLGTEYVHRYVGKEPSGLRFNKLLLNEDGKNYIKVTWKRNISFVNLSRFFFFFEKNLKHPYFFTCHENPLKPIEIV